MSLDMHENITREEQQVSEELQNLNDQVQSISDAMRRQQEIQQRQESQQRFQEHNREYEQQAPSHRLNVSEGITANGGVDFGPEQIRIRNSELVSGDDCSFPLDQILSNINQSLRDVIILNGPVAGKIKRINPNDNKIQFFVEQEVEVSNSDIDNPKHEKTLVIDDDGNEEWITNWEGNISVRNDAEKITLDVVGILINEKVVFVATYHKFARKLKQISGEQFTVEYILEVCESEADVQEVTEHINEFGEPYPETPDFQQYTVISNHGRVQGRTMYTGTEGAGIFEQIEDSNQENINIDHGISENYFRESITDL